MVTHILRIFIIQETATPLTRYNILYSLQENWWNECDKTKRCKYKMCNTCMYKHTATDDKIETDAHNFISLKKWPFDVTNSNQIVEFYRSVLDSFQGRRLDECHTLSFNEREEFIKGTSLPWGSTDHFYGAAHKMINAFVRKRSHMRYQALLQCKLAQNVMSCKGVKCCGLVLRDMVLRSGTERHGTKVWYWETWYYGLVLRDMVLRSGKQRCEGILVCTSMKRFSIKVWYTLQRWEV